MVKRRISAMLAVIALVVSAFALHSAHGKTTNQASDQWTGPSHRKNVAMVSALRAPRVIADNGAVVKQRVTKTDGVTTSYEAQAGCTEGSIRSATGYLRLGYTKWSDGFIRVDYLTVIGSQSFYLNETDEYSRRVAPLPSVYYVGPWYNTTWATSRTWTRAFSFSDGATQIYAYMRFGLASYWPAYACTVGYSVYA